MGKKNNLPACKGHRDFTKYIGCRGATLDRQNGSHEIWEMPDHSLLVLPSHPGDYATGTRHAIIKLIIAAGLGLLVIAIVFLPLVA